MALLSLPSAKLGSFLVSMSIQTVDMGSSPPELCIQWFWFRAACPAWRQPQNCACSYTGCTPCMPAHNTPALTAPPPPAAALPYLHTSSHAQPKWTVVIPTTTCVAFSHCQPARVYAHTPPSTVTIHAHLPTTQALCTHTLPPTALPHYIFDVIYAVGPFTCLCPLTPLHCFHLFTASAISHLGFCTAAMGSMTSHYFLVPPHTPTPCIYISTHAPTRCPPFHIPSTLPPTFTDFFATTAIHHTSTPSGRFK